MAQKVHFQHLLGNCFSDAQINVNKILLNNYTNLNVENVLLNLSDPNHHFLGI